MWSSSNFEMIQHNTDDDEESTLRRFEKIHDFQLPANCSSRQSSIVTCLEKLENNLSINMQDDCGDYEDFSGNGGGGGGDCDCTTTEMGLCSLITVTANQNGRLRSSLTILPAHQDRLAEYRL